MDFNAVGNLMHQDQARAVSSGPVGLHLPRQSKRRARLCPQPSSGFGQDKENRHSVLITLFLHLLLNFHNETTTFELTLTASQAAGELLRLL